MIARLVAVALAAVVAWRFLAKRSRPDDVVAIGWTDGSSADLEAGSPERELLVEVARGVLPR